MLSSLKIGGTFWDLGCGTGKPVAIASLFFEKSKGVELLENLAKAGNELMKHFGDTCEIIQGDIFETDYSDANLIYSSCLCFSNELVDRL